ncbi:MAG: hypothetical protein ABI781_11725 [Burkholderiales bacterium]
MDPTIRLRIATRIHFALLRQYGEDVAVSTLLGDEGDAREALWVCEASGHDELVLLAKQFKAMPKPMPLIAPRRTIPGVATRAAVPQDMAWSQDTSGFGLSRPPEAMATLANKPAQRSMLSRWLHGNPR